MDWEIDLALDTFIKNLLKVTEDLLIKCIELNSENMANAVESRFRISLRQWNMGEN